MSIKELIFAEGAEFGVLTLADNGRSLLAARSQRGSDESKRAQHPEG